MGDRRKQIIGFMSLLTLGAVLLVGYRIWDTARATVNAASEMSGATDVLSDAPQPQAVSQPKVAPLPSPRRLRRKANQPTAAAGDQPIRLERKLPPNLKSKLIRRFDGKLDDKLDLRLRKEQMIRAKRVPLGGRGDLRNPGLAPGFQQRGERIEQGPGSMDDAPDLALPVDAEGQVGSPMGAIDTGPQ